MTNEAMNKYTYYTLIGVGVFSLIVGYYLNNWRIALGGPVLWLYSIYVLLDGRLDKIKEDINKLGDKNE